MKNKSVLIILAIVVISIAMRAPMGGIGPLLGTIQSDLALSSSSAGFITTLPLLLFSLTASFAGALTIKIGCRRIIPISLASIFVGVFLRSNFSAVGMFLGTAIIGIGTGLLNIALPTLIKQYFPNRIGFVMGIYSTSLTFSSAITAAIIQPLNGVLGNWKLALLSLALPVVLAFILSAFSLHGMKEEEQQKVVQKRSILNARNISIAFYMGIQSMLFFTLLTWYPTMIKEQYGIGGNVGMLITIMQIASLVPAYLTPILSERYNPGILASSLALLFAPGILIAGLGSSGFTLMLGTILQGLSVGACFSMGVTLCTMNGRDASETARITSFGQCFGYILASIGPSGFGKIYDAFGAWNNIFIIMAILACIMSGFGLFAGYRKAKN